MEHEDIRGREASAIREDVFTTLAIAALLHEDNAGVQKSAAVLAKRAPGSLRKKTLLPLAESHYARSIIMETAVFPTEEKVIGTAEHEGEKYDITVQYTGPLNYTPNEILSSVADMLVQRGHVTGRLYITIIDPVYRGKKTDSVMLSSHAKYSIQNYDGIQQEA